jgi:RNA-directed DNA polymerase
MRNKGAPGVDGMTVKQLPDGLEQRWPQIARALVEGRYRPQPVKRVRILKPDGGKRRLGIPTVIDRMIQQAILQRLQPEWDASFSEHSFGFRPGRSRTRRWRRRKPMSSQGTSMSWTSIWRSSCMSLHTAPRFMRFDRRVRVAGLSL